MQVVVALLSSSFARYVTLHNTKDVLLKITLYHSSYFLFYNVFDINTSLESTLHGSSQILLILKTTVVECFCSKDAN